MKAIFFLKHLAKVQLVRDARDLESIWPEALRRNAEAERQLASCAYCGLQDTVLASQLGACEVFSSPIHYAHELYEFLRTVDRLGLQQLYCQIVPDVGIGSALNDRLTRAAS